MSHQLCTTNLFLLDLFCKSGINLTPFDIKNYLEETNSIMVQSIIKIFLESEGRVICLKSKTAAVCHATLEIILL